MDKQHYEMEAASIASQTEQEKADFSLIALLGLDPFRDGNTWCFLWGANLHEGVAGFGSTVRGAAQDFLNNVYKPVSDVKKGSPHDRPPDHRSPPWPQAACLARPAPR